ncbi:pseudouridylate synthase 7 homolog [Daktulosphaira vitifoliae]|uniref:pseudouridylate synthase 7 homolog n=1 Tax=Daktulosphaira vitifoliae TaxID=58002 RepID=UPI0021AAA354|nr:pseudouridylate synthase 7 homolog [Daktulosphaira vitifoliae]
MSVVVENNENMTDFGSATKNNFRPSKKVIYEGLHEIDVGITEYSTSVPGISAILKHRLSDFQVNEIDLDGNVIRLNSTTVPEKEAEVFEPKDFIDSTGLCSSYINDIDDLIVSKSTRQIEICVDGLTKEERTSMHKFFSSKFGTKISTSTINKAPNKQFIVIKLANLVKNERQSWPKSRPEYLHFALHKCNMDTTQVVSILSKQLKVKVNMIKHAGTKDKRGNTTQMMSIRRIEANKLVKVSARNVWIGNYVYKDATLKLGDLKGNRFNMVLRNISANNNDVTKNIELLKTNGFINYYGLQRFGSSMVSPTYVIGKSLACGNFEQAIEHVLKPRPMESSFETDLDRARAVWWETRDPKSAIQQLSKKNFTIEAKILRSLAFNGPKSYVNAFQLIPRNLVMLYLHSYQSLLWNKIVSRRIKEFGLKPIIGDLVLVEREIHEQIVEVMEDEEVEVEQDDKFPDVTAITEETLENYSIYDVVYPLPGFNVCYPNNKIGQWYTEILAEDGLTSEKLMKKDKLFSLKGTYRKCVSKASDIVWSIVNHNDLNDDLLLSDHEKLEGKKPFKSVLEGKYRSLLIEFSLQSSNYATMVVRELTKQDTSSHSQASFAQVSEKHKIVDENINTKKPKLDES